MQQAQNFNTTYKPTYASTFTSLNGYDANTLYSPTSTQAINGLTFPQSQYSQSQHSQHSSNSQPASPHKFQPNSQQPSSYNSTFSSTIPLNVNSSKSRENLRSFARELASETRLKGSEIHSQLYNRHLLELQKQQDRIVREKEIQKLKTAQQKAKSEKEKREKAEKAEKAEKIEKAERMELERLQIEREQMQSRNEPQNRRGIMSSSQIKTSNYRRSIAPLSPRSTHHMEPYTSQSVVQKQRNANINKYYPSHQNQRTHQTQQHTRMTALPTPERSESRSRPRTRSIANQIPHRHYTNDQKLLEKWKNPNLEHSTLLAGSSLFPHIPGAQYCIDAGLHHHHPDTEKAVQIQSDPETEESTTESESGSEEEEEEEPALLPEPAPAIEVDLAWFAEMERKLRILSEQIEDDQNDGDLYKAKYVALVQRLEEMSQLQKERLMAEQERRRREEEERDRRERELAMAWERYCVKMVAEEREKWFKELESLRTAMKQEVDRLTDGFEQERHQLLDEIQQLQSTIDRLRELEHLPEEVAYLQNILQQRDQEIHDLRSAQFTVAVEQEVMPKPKPLADGYSKIWASGPIDRTKLKTKIQHDDLALRSPAKVKVIPRYNDLSLPENMFQVELKDTIHSKSK